MTMALQFRVVNFAGLKTFNHVSSMVARHGVAPCSRQMHTHRISHLLRHPLCKQRNTSTLSKKSYMLYGPACVNSRFKSSTAGAEQNYPAGFIPDAPAAPPPGSATSALGNLPEGYIPDAPPVPLPEGVDALGAMAQQLNALGEPTLQSLGLGSWFPSGMVQMGLEQLHLMGLPWWGAIMAGTVVLRLAVFPLVILAQRNAANMHNHMPVVQRLQERFTQARMGGNPMEAAKLGNELMNYMQRNKVNPMKNMLVPFAQIPVFLSVFIGLRQMANLPVESMTTGGVLWFTDLTVPDPFYAMPILTMATLLATIEIGADGVRAGSMSQNVKYVMRAMPFFICPFIINFPAALVTYWMCSNAFSLCQVLFLKIPSVRAFFNIPVMVKHDPAMMPKKKGFREGFSENWKNSKMAASIEDRQRLDAVRFKEAGMGPVRKTYAYDPTKVKSKESARAK